MIEILIGKSGAGKTSYLKAELQKYSKKDVAYLPQEIAEIFNPIRTIYAQIFEMSFEKNDFDSLIKQLNLLSLKDSLKKYPYEFSVGELQRIALLMIFLRKDVKKIFLDEPTSALDEKNIKKLEEIIKNIKIPMLIVTHNLNFAKNISENIKIIGESIDKLHENYDNSLENLDILAQNYKKVKSVDIFNINTDVDVLNKNISENTLIFGESGYGKSSLLQKIYKDLIKNDQKTIFIGQDYGFSLPFSRKIIKTLVEAIKFRDKKYFYTKKDVKEIIFIFRKFGLSVKLLRKYPAELSLGERQKILIIRAILIRTNIILLDEPSSALDYLSERNLIAFLLFMQNTYNIRLVVVSHSSFVINSLLKQSCNVIYFKQQLLPEFYIRRLPFMELA